MKKLFKVGFLRKSYKTRFLTSKESQLSLFFDKNLPSGSRYLYYSVKRMEPVVTIMAWIGYRKMGLSYSGISQALDISPSAAKRYVLEADAFSGNFADYRDKLVSIARDECILGTC